MNDRYLERFGAASGIIFMLLALVALLVVMPAPPASDAPAREVSRYYIEEQRSIQAGVVIASISMFFYLWFLGSLRSVLRAAEGGAGWLSTVAFGGGLATLIIIIISLLFTAVAAFRPEETSPELTRALNDISSLAAGPNGFAFAAFFVATAVVVLRTGVLPAWLGWLALLPALGQALNPAGVVEDSGVFAADSVLTFLGSLAWLLWFLVASVVLVLRSGTKRAAKTATTGGQSPNASSTATSRREGNHWA